MKFLNKSYLILRRAAALSFVLTLFFYLGSYLVKETSYIAFSLFLFISLFSFIQAILFEIFYIKSIKLSLRTFLNYVLSIISFLIIFSISGNIQKRFSSIFVMILMFTIIYGIAYVILYFTVRKTEEFQSRIQYIKPKNETPYEKKF